MELFRKRGYIQQYRDGLFSPASWLAVYNGQGLAAEGYDPMADTVPLAPLADKLADLARRINEHVAAMPDHATRIATFCGTAAMTAGAAR
ncbi:MAG: tryptophan 7-halogenase [Asticcacaulis sp.]